MRSRYWIIFALLGVILVIVLIYSAGYHAGMHAAAASQAPREDGGIQKNAEGNLGLPIEGLKPSDLLDTFNQARSGGRRHEATDILAPRGTPVHAVTDGVIQKLFFSKAGGNTIYEFDTAGVYCYYYAHLDHYAPDLREGQAVNKGAVIGYVGTTGDAPANTPHLHLAILRLGPEKHWWEGTPVDLYPILLELADQNIGRE